MAVGRKLELILLVLFQVIVKQELYVRVRTVFQSLYQGGTLGSILEVVEAIPSSVKPEVVFHDDASVLTIDLGIETLLNGVVTDHLSEKHGALMLIIYLLNFSFMLSQHSKSKPIDQWSIRPVHLYKGLIYAWCQHILRINEERAVLVRVSANDVLPLE